MNKFQATLLAAVVSLSIVGSAKILSKFFVKIDHQKGIVVKGYAKKRVTSDLGNIKFSVNAKASTVQLAYKQLGENLSKVRAFLKNVGVPDESVELRQNYKNATHKLNEKGKRTNEIEYISYSQYLMIESKNVKMIKNLPKTLGPLINQGIEVSVNQPNFFVSNIDEVKLELLQKATENGTKRADILAESSGGKVEALMSARQGVFQITTPNSTDTSGYGLYDTSTIEKVIKAVVTLQFSINNN